MRFDLDTIMKAIQLAGPATAGAKAIYDGFLVVLVERDQDALKRRYAAARSKTDADHETVQQELGR